MPSQYYLPHLLQNFHEKYPDIAFNIQMEDSPKVIEMVATRAVEIGFSGTRVENHKCISQEFAGDCMAVITPNTEKFRAYAGRHLPKELLLSETFISREKSSGTYQAGREILERMGVDIAQLRTAIEVRSSESVKQMVGEGLGIGLISLSAARDYVQFEKVLAFPFEEEELRRKLYIVKHKTASSRPLRRSFTTTRGNITKSIRKKRPSEGAFPFTAGIEK